MKKFHMKKCMKNFSFDPISKILWWCIFCHQQEKLCWDYFAIRTASTFVHI